MITFNLPAFRQAFPADLVSPQEHKLARVKGYEFDWSTYARALFDLDRPEDNPSWLKAITDVRKAQGLWKGFYQSLTGNASGKLRGTNASDFALSHLVGDKVTGVMQFVPVNSDGLLEVAAIAQSLLPEWIVVPLVGKADATNEEAEGIVKDHVLKAKLEGKSGVWVISQGIGSRSFSIPEINVVLLTYDNGSIGATVQKMSRCLTAGAPDKIGHIISFSIDGNRSDVIATLALDAALKAACDTGGDLEEILRRVRRTIPIFDLDEAGNAAEVTADEYLERAMSLTAARQLVVNRQTVLELEYSDVDDLSALLDDLPTQLDRLGGKSVLFDLGVRFLDGKIVNRQNQEVTEESLRARVLKIVQEKLAVLTDRMAYLVYFLPDRSSVTLDRLVQFVQADSGLLKDFQESFGVSLGDLEWLLSKQFLNREMLELVMLKSI